MNLDEKLSELFRKNILSMALAGALLAMFLSLPGCAGPELLSKIPNNEFSNFEYHRAGNATSVDIVAKGAKKTPDGIQVDNVDIKADYGPFVNFNIKLENYRMSPTIPATKD